MGRRESVGRDAPQARGYSTPGDVHFNSLHLFLLNDTPADGSPDGKIYTKAGSAFVIFPANILC